MGITSESVIVVSGGGRGITAQCVIEMAKLYQCKFILLGRSSIEGEEPAFAAGIDDEMSLRKAIIADVMQRGEKPVPAQIQRTMKGIFSRREIQGTLDAISAAGGEAIYVSADITNAEALRPALQDAGSKMGAITGIMHGAGNLSDKLIENKTIDDFEYVFGTKIDGLNNLLAVIPAEQLQQLILFSSAAGFFGNPGQSDYAIANEVLNKVAYYFHHNYPQTQVLSINWGPWDAGMVTEELKKVFAERNISVIPVDVGTRILLDQLEKAVPDVQVLVGDPMGGAAILPSTESPQFSIHRRITEAANPFLASHVVGEHAVLPMLHALAWMCSSCENLYPGFQFVRSDGYRVFKGVVFDENAAEDYTLNVQEISREAGQVALKTTISSEQNGKPRFHFGTTVILEPSVPDAPLFEGFDLSDTAALNGAEFYRNGKLFHGPVLQGVERVLNISEKRVTTRCIMPDIPYEVQGQFYAQSFNPFMADISLQSMLIYVWHYRNAASLPLQIKEVEQFRPIRAGQVFYSTMDVTEIDDNQLEASFHIHDENGRLYLQTDGAVVTISEHLNQLFLQSSKRNHS